MSLYKNKYEKMKEKYSDLTFMKRKISNFILLAEEEEQRMFDTKYFREKVEDSIILDELISTCKELKIELEKWKGYPCSLNSFVFEKNYQLFFEVVLFLLYHEEGEESVVEILNESYMDVREAIVTGILGHEKTEEDIINSFCFARFSRVLIEEKAKELGIKLVDPFTGL
jgi:hypothetical protein